MKISAGSTTKYAYLAQRYTSGTTSKITSKTSSYIRDISSTYNNNYFSSNGAFSTAKYAYSNTSFSEINHSPNTGMGDDSLKFLLGHNDTYFNNLTKYKSTKVTITSSYMNLDGFAIPYNSLIKHSYTTNIGKSCYNHISTVCCYTNSALANGFISSGNKAFPYFYNTLYMTSDIYVSINGSSVNRTASTTYFTLQSMMTQTISSKGRFYTNTHYYTNTRKTVTYPAVILSRTNMNTNLVRYTNGRYYYMPPYKYTNSFSVKCSETKIITTITDNVNL